VQLVESKVPVELLSKVTPPVGVVGLDGEVSATVTLHVELWLTSTRLAQPSVVLTALVPTLMLVCPLLEP
jgi:hypothetical protein